MINVQVTAEQVLTSLKSVQAAIELTNEQRISLLKFFMSEINIGQLDLTGLQLLPLEDDSWAVVNAATGSRVYMANGEHIKYVLPTGVLFF